MLKSTKIIIVIGFVLFVIVLINTFTTKHVSYNNSVEIEGHFSSIKEINLKNDHYYDIYLTETNKPYHTGESSGHCLAYDALKNNIKKNDPIKIYTCKNSFFTDPEVVGLTVGNWGYMSLDCVNKQVDKNKITIPLISALVTLCLSAMLINLIAKIKTLRTGLKEINNS